MGDELELSCDELDVIAQACSEFDKDYERPPSLQGFLVFRLRDRFPRLATHIENFSTAQIDQLWALLTDRASANYWSGSSE